MKKYTVQDIDHKIADEQIQLVMNDNERQLMDSIRSLREGRKKNILEKIFKK